MFTLEYTDENVGFLVHRWEDKDYLRALVIAQHVDKQISARDVVFKRNGEFAFIWPSTLTQDLYTSVPTGVKYYE